LTTFTVTVADVQFDGLTLAPLAVSTDSQMVGNRVGPVGVFAAMVTFPSASTEIGPVVIGNSLLFVVTASPFKCRF
jgi:hypothetical protein